MYQISIHLQKPAGAMPFWRLIVYGKYGYYLHKKTAPKGAGIYLHSLYQNLNDARAGARSPF